MHCMHDSSGVAWLRNGKKLRLIHIVMGHSGRSAPFEYRRMERSAYALRRQWRSIDKIAEESEEDTMRGWSMLGAITGAVRFIHVIFFLTR